MSQQDHIPLKNLWHMIYENIELSPYLFCGYGRKTVAGGAWLLLPDNNLLTEEEQDGLGTSEGYVVITDEDIVEGVAAFVAKLISTIPQSKVSMSKSRPPPVGIFEVA